MTGSESEYIVKDLHELESLASIQVELRSRHREITSQLDCGTLSPEGYLNGVEAALGVAMERARVLLGDERFDAIFGEAGRHPGGMIDREVFLSQGETA